MLIILLFIIVLSLFQITIVYGFNFSNSKLSIKLLLNQITSSSSSSDVSSKKYNNEIVKEFLNTILSSRSTLKDRSFLIEQLQGLRDNENDGTISRSEDKSTPAVWNGTKTDFLNEMLDEIDKVNDIIKFLPKFLPSYRVKLLILKTLMDKILIEDLNPYDSSRRRRALSMVLGQLRNSETGIRELIKEESIRTQKEEDFIEMLDRTPTKLETPKFNIVYNFLSSRSSHVRKYEEFSVCSLIMNEQVSQQGGAFNFLAGYIFGSNKSSQKMAMTTPVISKSSEKKMSFVMPSAYWNDISNAPAPVNDVVKLEDKYLKDDYFAAIWFGGYSNKDTVDKKTKELMKILEEDKNWKVKDTSNPESLLLQYNDPFQPPWKRRNEILIKVVGNI